MLPPLDRYVSSDPCIMHSACNYRAASHREEPIDFISALIRLSFCDQTISHRYTGI